jgi:hypothetical protein
MVGRRTMAGAPDCDRRWGDLLLGHVPSLGRALVDSASCIMPSTAPPDIEYLRINMRVRRILFAIFAVHLVMCIRFFHKYVDAAPWLVHVAYAAAALLALLVVLHSRFLFGLFTTTWALVMALAGLLLLVLVAYPRADALREVGRGSDQDDCVRTLVHNVFNLRNPFGFGYFGDPCSTGPSEFFLFWPVQVSTGFFILAPVLWTAAGYWVLRQVTNRAVAVLLTLSLFSSWLFLEMSSEGSDMVAIAWLFTAGTVACGQGLRKERPGLLLVGAFSYVMFAGSRVPLLIVATGSLLVLLMAAGTRAVPVAASVLFATTALYVGSYAVAPDAFTPGHLVGKSLRIIRELGGGLQIIGAVVGLTLVAALALLASRRELRAVARRHYYPLNAMVMAVPMAAAALWDLSRRGYELGTWEGLNYLFLAVPALLVAGGEVISTQTSRAPRSPGAGEIT